MSSADVLTVKGFGFNPKNPFISEEYYFYHFQEIHGPVALEMDQIRRYIQLHGTSQRLAPFSQSIYLAHAECWFESVDSHQSCKDDPNRLLSGRDGLTLHDKTPGRQVELSTIESVKFGHDVEPGTEGLTKGVLLVRKHHTAGTAEFQSWWHNTLPALVRSTIPGLVRHVQSVADTDRYLDCNPVFDGVLELWWDDPALLDTGVDLTDFAAHLKGSPISFQDTVSHVGKEIRIRWPGHPEQRRSPERDRISGLDIVRMPNWLLEQFGPR
ncbi:hypothetical protein ABH922_000047 [Rhodococcus sp. 27YEA15]|uniref:hypothetical protein n=1 Tax=Rhodococcus sp. 27YEA15 TaxID=3156259 RepID=UPI003C7CF242